MLTNNQQYVNKSEVQLREKFILMNATRVKYIAHMQQYAIIVAGGKGTRMSADVPKQLMLLAGKPVLMYSIEKFYQCNAEVVVVLHNSLFEEWKSICHKFDFRIPHQLVAGGESRSESVFKGLNLLKDKNGVVAIHDAARPMLSLKLIVDLFEAAKKFGNAVPVLKIAESLRKLNGTESEVVNRDAYITIQTPQCFNVQELLFAYSHYTNPDFTDDATLFESLGNKIHLVEGEKINFKITVADDIKIAEALIKKGN